MPAINFLATNKIRSHYIIDTDIKCHLALLPFANNSIDLIVCPHTLEISNKYDYFLQECYRVLIPNGKIIISNFNPKSMFGLFAHLNPLLKQLNYTDLNKLQQQLIKLNFNICGGRFFAYRLPINNPTYLSNLAFLDKIGDRWFPTFANCYAIVAKKELITPNIIGSKLKREFNSTLVPNLGLI
jgi:ubiquinone/menaquinone biosynthesis C-methylase UbiE